MSNVVQLDDFREPDFASDEIELIFGGDANISGGSEDRFAIDLQADELANQLVHTLMVDFVQQTNADLASGKYHSAMEAMAEVARMMTRRHFDVIDSYNLLLDQDPNSILVIGVGVDNSDEDDSDG